MSRCSTKALATRGQDPHLRQSRPRSGTELGDFYDFLMRHRGRPVVVRWQRFFAKATRKGRAMEDLRDYWGLDLRRLGDGALLLAGEWHGRVYVDYVAEASERRWRAETTTRELERTES